MIYGRPGVGFNPWYVGGGVKSGKHHTALNILIGFNPWYVGGGVKSTSFLLGKSGGAEFQSLVCWRGC